MKRKHVKLILKMWGIYFLSLQISLAQTPQQNLEKYWNYRDRFKKYFIKLGKEQGEGILVSFNRCPKNNTDCSCNPGGNTAHLKWGDATAFMGDHLAILATEYALLKQLNNDR